MGLLSWIFPSDDDRIATAKSMLERGKPNDARMELLGIEKPAAQSLLQEAEQALAILNLQHAISWAQAGDDRRVQVHLELVDEYDHGDDPEKVLALRRELRMARTGRSEAADHARRQKESKQRAADPLGVTGGASWLQDNAKDDLYDAEREVLEARLALIVENYPEDLRSGVADLGTAFAKAVLDLEEGQASKALVAMLALDDSAPLVRWERARATHMLGDPKAAAHELRGFAELVGRHRNMGRQHSGELLALVTAEAGDVKGALRVIRSVRADEPEQGGALFGQLLLANNQLPEAESVLTKLIKLHPRSQGLYALLARVRVAGDHRQAAATALEASMQQNCCSPGQCGNQAPSHDVLRSLATLYLEDGIEQERALDFAQQALAMVKRPGWDDAYLQALVARRTGGEALPARRTQLLTALPDGDKRTDRVTQYLG